MYAVVMLAESEIVSVLQQVS